MNLVCYNAPLEEQAMSARGEVLVAIVNNVHDFAVARDHHWYRVPIDNVEKRLKNCWPPQWLAFYQTKDFGEEAYAVHYYARVLSLRERGRHDLFPDEPPNAKSHRRYYQLMLDHLQRLPTPIVSRRFRRVIFIPTTMMKLYTASELHDLWDESPLEDALWGELKRRDVVAERQEFVEVDGRPYFLFDGMLIAPDADEGSEGVILLPLPASEASAEARQTPLVDVPPDAPSQRKKRK